MQNIKFLLRTVIRVILLIMKSHFEIDQRSLALARAVAAEIDHDPERRGLQKAQETCLRWFRNNPVPAVEEWLQILNQEWDDVRAVLLNENEQGQRLRQSSPFCGILTPKTRWSIYRQFNHESKTA